MNIQKISGPFTADEARERIACTTDSLYVVAIEDRDGEWYNKQWGCRYELVTGSGAFIHGFLIDIDIIREITLWK